MRELFIKHTAEIEKISITGDLLSIHFKKTAYPDVVDCFVRNAIISISSQAGEKMYDNNLFQVENIQHAEPLRLQFTSLLGLYPKRAGRTRKPLYVRAGDNVSFYYKGTFLGSFEIAQE